MDKEKPKDGGTERGREATDETNENNMTWNEDDRDIDWRRKRKCTAKDER